MAKDFIRRSICLILAVVLGVLWWYAYRASAPDSVPMVLAGLGIAYAVAGLSGSNWLHWVLLFGLMGGEGDSAT